VEKETYPTGGCRVTKPRFCITLNSHRYIIPLVHFIIGPDGCQ
jgi:hypothetical protein